MTRRTPRRALFACGFALAAAVLAAGGASAQTPERRGRLVMTVADQSGAVIPLAVVTVTGSESLTQSAAIPPTSTNGVGIAVVEGLPEGRYTIHVEFPGFDPVDVRDVRVRGAETRRRITLRIKKLDQEITVRRDRQSSSLDPAGSAFSTVLTRDQIDALPDDPDEMAEVLKAMAPPGSVIRVDGFTGGRLPHKSQIRSIRLPRLDMFAAQNHGGMSGMMFIDIMTMPGNGPIRGSVDVHFLDDAFNARNPFTTTKPQEQLRQYGASLSGTITPNKTSFSLNGGGSSQYTSPNLLAVLPSGSTVTDTLRQPRDAYNFSARLDHALTRDHAMRLSVDRTSSTSRSLGVGGFNLFDRAYDNSSSTNLLRMSENGALGRKFFTESRFQLKTTGASNRSAVEAETIRVQDAFTSGGAQQRGGQRSTEFELASDLDYVRGAHSWRTGVLLEGGRYRSDDTTNYLGTYGFASLTDFLAGRPMSYSRRIGDPNVTYSTYRAAIYVQDDYRITRSLLVSPGVRYGVQSQVSDRWNLSPRMSAAWSPFKDGRMTLRGSYGYFYDWLAGDLYKQTLLVDGYRQRESNIFNPSYPDPGVDGATAPTNQYLWSDSLVLPSANRVSLGVDRTLSQNGRLSVSYTRGWGIDLLRGRNLNAPAGGVRPDPAFANRVELVTDAASRSQAVSMYYSFVRMDKKRMFLMLNYTLSKSETNTTGAFSIPPSGDSLQSEWGPSAGDIRHRVGASFNISPIPNVTVGINLRGQSGMPFNITTGRDDNADGVFNDRPAGVARNSARGAAQWDLGGRISYGFGFGTPRQAGGPGGGQVVINAGGGGGLAPGFGGAAADKRLRLEFYVSGQNLLNRTNYTAYSFVMTSPFFGRPLAASQPRKLQVGARFTF
ncbi:MAG: TonB-dependent receptor [Acidobacteria bacterium]|nr:TonB-dependent receptor [Acidobacteriota bacterium]